MNTTLLLLEQALADWRKWQLALSCQPTLCRQLPGGQSNQTFVLDAGNRQLVLRLGMADAHLLGVDRERELQIILLAADAGLAPKVFYAEPGNGLLVTEYLAGCKPDRHLLSSQQWQATLSNAIAAMRTLSVDVAPYPYRQQLQSYWQQLLKAGYTELEPQYRKALAALALLQTSQTPESLVHHDLSVDNLLLVADQLMFLDWEYAGKGYTIMDDVALLKLGLNRSSDHSASQWQAAQCIAEFLDKGWYLLR